MNRKTQVRLCLLPMLAVVLYLLITALYNHFSLQKLYALVDSAGEFYNNATADGEVGDVEGYGAILSGLGYLTGSVIYAICDFLMVWLPVAVAAVGGFGVLVARLLYAPEPPVRLVLFRVQMVLLYLLFGVAAALLLMFAFSTGGLFAVRSLLFSLPVLAAIVCSAIFSFRKPSAG